MENNIVNSIQTIDEAIKGLKEKQKEEEKQIEQLRESKSIICKINNICPICLGKGSIYDKEEAMRDNDPYSRSSDFYKTCLKCNGTGKFER